MSKTAIVWLVTYFAGVLYAFKDPVYGLFTYFLDYYEHPPLRWWGEEFPDLRWSFSISVLTLVLYFIKKGRFKTVATPWHPQSKWLFLFAANAVLVTLTTAVWQEKSWEKVVEILKLVMLYFLITRTVRTKKQFRNLLLVHIAGIFSWGWNAYTNPHRRAGRLYGIGGPDSIEDNGTAAHLLAILPLLGTVYFTGKRWEKGLCVLSAVFAVNAFILCNSRGGVVGLAMVMGAGLVLTKGAMRGKVFMGIIVGLLLLYALADPQFIARQQTIKDYNEDSSATGRLDSWMGAIRLVEDHPFGVGGGGFEYLSPIYIPEIVAAHKGQNRSVHSTYFLVVSDWGIQGLFFFMAFTLSTFRELHVIRKTAEKHRNDSTTGMTSLALTLGYVGLLGAGIFIVRAYAESVYWLPAFTAVLRDIQLRELKEIKEADAAALA